MKLACYSHNGSTRLGVVANERIIALDKAGDVVRVEIEGLGHIENRVIAEP